MSGRKTTTAKLIPLREEQVPSSLFLEHFLAIDASYYAIRIVFCDNSLRVLNSLECQPDEMSAVTHFVSDIIQKYPYIRVVGSPLSRWPQRLEKVLSEEGVKIQWLSPELMREVGRTLVYWNQKRRLHRAGLLAFLAKCDPPVDYRTAHDHTLFWEGRVANEILGEVQSELCPDQCEGFAD